MGGVARWGLRLNEPPPEVIDQAPVVALPPTLAPVKVIAAGVADWHTLLGPPAFAVGAAFTVIVLVSLAAAQAPGAFDVSVKVTVPEKLAAGVYVILAGLAVCAVELSEPPPEVI